MQTRYKLTTIIKLNTNFTNLSARLMCWTLWSCPLIYASTLYFYKMRTVQCNPIHQKAIQNNLTRRKQCSDTSRIGKTWLNSSLVSPWWPTVWIGWCPKTSFQVASEFCKLISRSCIKKLIHHIHIYGLNELLFQTSFIISIWQLFIYACNVAAHRAF